MSPLRLAWINLTRRRMPTVIVLVAIAVSVAVSGMLLRLYILSGARFATMAGHVDVVVGAKAGGMDILLGSLNAEGEYPGYVPYKLFQSLRDKQTVRFEDGAVKETSYLKSVTPFVYFGKYRQHRIIGTDESFFTNATSGLVMDAGKWFAADGDVVLGSDVARRENLKPGDTIPADSWTGTRTNLQPVSFTMKVTGVLRRTGTVWDQSLFGTVGQAHAVLRQGGLTGNGNWDGYVLNYFLVNLDAPAMPALETLINGRTVGQVISVPREKQRLAELTNTGRRLGFLMTALILLLGGLSVTAMMITRFEAMTIQLAVLRAIGYGRRAVAWWLIWEGLMLGCAACVIGATVDGVLFPWLRSALGAALPAPEMLACPLWQSWPVWLTALAATILAVLIPLHRLYRQNIHNSLRGV